ncbi:MAG: bifunctional phosphopantothenoylcysteine decarboxylase/phosphopantothenate--cysteine ligase CoaBC [Paludibacteraceae bacterium]|nr:bifunctional phosphopantothenoylcysteine decarboxylase/phosphopantothenate--cysteine ligase CoaBC [Paludibacteraceae bacterium]MBN2786681.1 bifunctional phosphopantothenoylcysteine decarboxylase/phosphopantothenate--cysteine ligase CoaBC [Paludibacteraceae bacterium]
MLKGKKIILGVTGSIAAYKTAPLIRLLVKQGAEVKVIMTPLAKEFITPLTLATVAQNPILVDFFDPTNGAWNSHVNLGLWADLYLIAPATANTIGKMANGIADNLLLTTYFSAKCPVVIAPAMDVDMYAHPATQKNITTLRAYGNYIIEAENGELASGLEGKGRMQEPEVIVDYITTLFSKKKSLANKKVLITAGPTYEKIDPVRFIGNYSSGKMGFALAQACADKGAQVTLIAGPVNLSINHPRISRIDVESAEEMHLQAIKHFKNADISILAAAVADFTPTQKAASKIKKKDQQLTIELTQTKDIAAELGKLKKSNQLIVGFALETDNEEVNALEKLQKKNFDFIVLNSLKDKNAGFKHDTNKITIYSAKGTKQTYELKDKKLVAYDIIENIEKYLNK